MLIVLAVRNIEFSACCWISKSPQRISRAHKNSKMAPARKKQLGIDAVISCLAKFVHPSEHIRNTFPNGTQHNLRLEGCKVRHLEMKRVSKRD